VGVGHRPFRNRQCARVIRVLATGDLRRLASSELEARFGKYGVRLFELARGIDESPVVSDRPTQSISVEDTFEQDVLLPETEPMIRRLAEKLLRHNRRCLMESTEEELTGEDA